MTDITSTPEAAAALPAFKGMLGEQVKGFGASQLTGWHIVVADPTDLPKGVQEGLSALVGRSSIFTYLGARWVFDSIGTGYLQRTRMVIDPDTVNIEQIEDRSAQHGIVRGSEDRREWNLGNWVAHLGGRINRDSYLEFGSLYALDQMINQMHKLMFRTKDDELKIHIVGGSPDDQKVIALLIGGVLDDYDVTPSTSLGKLIEEASVNPPSMDSLNDTADHSLRLKIEINIVPRN
ncbi:hypothetical protein FDJ23_gp101 [Erwinia phage vB_EamM_Desertfox]|uniref:Uncharacterized protein n=3 Tax=Agricanvirus TaxID=1984776 RepID=A0A2H5BIS8_9CAUD|nr:hypothetical protein FDJ23_gp101 [Erwinia phage vB_EamM_Desertfox]AUG85889.1 hypothetical protein BOSOLAPHORUS_102 [Erwinia phage vB_EamM_Bosolaphorus]AUG86208.1 hypothetical protein DESERTFOX_101 [Erwinia phage vB_EamM_Desertfox]AUG86531.1 hypothetical protein MADMEL_103 [Erwinia phage vB_EamM_MadMel]